MVLVTLKNLLTGGPTSRSDHSRRRSGTADATSHTLLADDTYTSYNATDDTLSDSSSLSFEGVSNPRVISDVIIGLSDGLTVPFALTAGLSSLGSSKLVITGGLAELVSGAISMGLGGFLAAKSENEYYHSMLKKERESHKENPEAFAEGVHEALGDFHLSSETIDMVVRDLSKNSKTVASFMVKMVRGIEEPSPGRELTSALTIGLSYFLGGFVPLVPYFFTSTVHVGLIVSILVMGFTLFVFGYVKTVLSLGSDCPHEQRFWSGISMFLTGGIAAGSAWCLVRLIDN